MNELDVPSTKTDKLICLNLTQTPCLTIVSNENEEFCCSRPFGLVRLSNEHDECNLRDDEEKTRKTNVLFTNLVNLETMPNITRKLMYRKLKQKLFANTIAETYSINKHIPRNNKTTKHFYIKKFMIHPKINVQFVNNCNLKKT